MRIGDATPHTNVPRIADDTDGDGRGGDRVGRVEDGDRDGVGRPLKTSRADRDDNRF